ncbi:glycoside hydrolase family 3 N-terminal domain-containing protein [Bacteroides sp. GM023]|uniref:glycoside hydrolase family 3 N-terminal domain-containing protein n=1 Tax=Bacteroides sp. GM023 TaxID=2723058 RepID=UPI00168B6845|nr:glycoside hydrolase family 3 N-terminal domain-containing protein [Bacteroides sp. GM023]MBD3592880.1 beta-glucosidase [Bacteroides sp. GM023]
MRLIQFIFIVLTFLLVSCKQEKKSTSAIAEDKTLEKKVELTLKKMSLEEKIGQMTQLTLDVVTKGESIYHTEFPLRLDEAMVDTVLRKYKVGSILNTPSNTPLTIEEWTRVITDLQKIALEETGIPLIYGVDQIHGTTYTIGGTLFPQEIGMGATFNPQLVYEGAKITAYETKAGNISWNFSPVLDLGRDARWPRIWETYGEDTYLVSKMGKACVAGYQGNDLNHIDRNQVAACLKHFLGYGAPYSGKDRTPSYISEQDLRERHFQPFLEAVKTGALSVMVNSGMNNGLPIHANYTLLTQWLKKDLDWDGVIVTDWADINNLCLRDKICENRKEAIKLAINAGVDMSMVPYEWSFCTYLKELVEEGEVSMERIDDAVRRILRMKFRLNLFERPYWEVGEYPDFGSEKHAYAALKSAEESITLLKNENGILPLDSSVRILVTGPNANSMRTLNGGWTLSWQGEKADVYASDYNTILEALIHRVGSGQIVYEPGVTYKVADPPTTSIPYWAENEPEIEKAVAAAGKVDYILLCVGENSYCETPGNLDDLTLSSNQIRLAKALASTGKPIILVLNEGRPRIISEIEPLVKAIVHVYLPGNYGGDALANILYGDVNPSGKLPYTYPRSVNSLITYDHKPCESLDKMEGAYDYDAIVSVQWAFGYGLSYTTFVYSNLEVNQKDFLAGDTLTFTVDVENTGNQLGKETVMLFINDVVASLTPDVRRLRAFEKIELRPGEKKTVTLAVEADELAFVDQHGRWTLEKGLFKAQVADQTLSLNCSKTKKWESSNR